jgi:hypothetical protein
LSSRSFSRSSYSPVNQAINTIRAGEFLSISIRGTFVGPAGTSSRKPCQTIDSTSSQLRGLIQQERLPGQEEVFYAASNIQKATLDVKQKAPQRSPAIERILRNMSCGHLAIASFAYFSFAEQFPFLYNHPISKEVFTDYDY